MKIAEFVNAYNAKKFIKVNNGMDEKSEYIKKELDIKTYIPFKDKRRIAEMIVETYTKEVDGIQKHDSISAYVGFVVAMMNAHTALEFGSNPIEDYDLLAESGLLPKIVAEFQESYNECDIVLKMALAMKLEENNVNVFVGKFLNGVLKKFDYIIDETKNLVGDLDIKELLGKNFAEDDLARLRGFLDTIK